MKKMIWTKMSNFTTYSGLLYESRQRSHRFLQAGLQSCLGGGKPLTLSSPEEDLVEDQGLPPLDCVRQKSNKELGESGIISGQDTFSLVGKMLSSSQTKTQIRKCLQANVSPASGVQRSYNCQHVSAAFHFFLNMTHPSRNLLSTRNCGHSSVRNYHMLHVSTSSLLLSSSSHRYFIRCGSDVFASYFSLLSQTLSSTLSNSCLGKSNVTLDKTLERSVSSGELHDEVYDQHIAKGDNCGSKETLDSSCVNQDENVDVRNDASYDNSKETTQFNPEFNENNDGTHNIYAKLYFNLMNRKLQNGSQSHQDEETAQTFDSYAKMYSKLTKSDGKDREESEIRLTHIDTDGKAVMVDVGDKTTTLREARAEGKIYLGPEAARLVKDNKMKKGDVLTVAQIAGITAAKQTAQLIPLCHNINLTKVDVVCVLNEKCHSIDITSLVRTIGVTGVEMEALTAVSIAALTVYDMCKAVTHDMVVSDVRLVSKSGGKRHFQR